MKKLLSMLLVIAMLISAFGTLPISAADDEPAQTDKGRAEIYDKDGKYDYASPTLDGAVLYAAQIGGKVKLLADRIDNKPLEIAENGDVTIDLNGFKIKSDLSLVDSDKDGSVIRLGKGAKLTIIDSSKEKSGIIEGGCAKWGGGIYAPKNNVVTMNAGTITNCYAYYGGGVYIDESSKFIMNGGKINSCNATYGGGVYVEDKATLETNGGEISDCVASKDGGGIYIWSAYANLNRCYIANNHADDGGAIFSDYYSSNIRSYITISGSTIVSNTADDCYGGIYHRDGGLTLQNGTMVSDNKNNGKYGGGVFSDSSIELGGAVYIYGNRSEIDEPCDVSFGKDLDSAFKIIDKLSNQSLIGVNRIYHKPKTWYNGDHVSYGGCQEEDKEKANSLATALFSNNDYTSGFSYTFEEKSGDLYEHLHYVRVVSGGSSDNEKINVTKVSYRNVPLSQSDYTAEYSSTTHTIVLNVPDYVKNQEYLTVETDKYNINFWAGNKVATSGWSEDYKTRCGLIVRNDNKSKSYTVTVEGGTVDGQSSAKKKYFDDLNIEPTVPEDKVFSHWEVNGDYTISSIIGFNQYTKIPPNMLMPNGNVTFKAILKDKVTQVDVKMTLPEIGSPTAFYVKTATNPCLTATACYKNANGTVIAEAPINVTWAMDENRDRTRPIAVHYFDYDVQYYANFQVEDTPNGNFGLADKGNLSMNLYIDDTLVTEGKETYFTDYEYVYGDGYNWQLGNDNNPIKRRILHATACYKSPKSPIVSVPDLQIEVQKGITVKNLKDLLPPKMNIVIKDVLYGNGNLTDQTITAPVEWDTAKLTDDSAVTDTLTLTGTVKIPENAEYDYTDGNIKQPVLTVKPISIEQSDKPMVSVDGNPLTLTNGKAKIAIGKKIKFTANDENAVIHYSVDGNDFVEYKPNEEIALEGKENDIVPHNIKAYCTKEGTWKSENLDLTIEVDNKTIYTVDILDSDGIEYKYANGGGEYRLGDTVSVNLTEKFMVNEGKPGSTEKEWVHDPRKIATAWSAKGILLDEKQKTNPEFEFEMPNSNVIIKIEKFGNRNEVHTVTIVDKDDKTYEYALGAGEYKADETVTIDSTQFMLKSVDADGKATSEPTNVPEKVVSQWSADGITLTEEQKKAGKFAFKMPYNNVTIKAENFRYFVKKLYLSSLTPISGKELPQTLEIVGARDANGKVIDKDNIMMNVTLASWQKYNENDKMYEPISDETYTAKEGEKYMAIFSVEPSSSGVTASCDDLEIYIDDKKIEPQLSLQGHYLIGWEFEAEKDELLSVDLADSITVYNISDVVLPQKVNVRTKYGTIKTADVEWSETEKMQPFLEFGTFELKAKVNLPDYVVDTNNIGTKKITVKLCRHINAVAMKTESGNIPAKAGEKLPVKDEINVTAVDRFTNYPKLESFEILTKDGKNVTGGTAEAGEEYTIKAKIGSKADYTVLSENTVFTINGKDMNIVDSIPNAETLKGNIYEVSYTFTAEDEKSYDVTVDGTLKGTYKNGDTVDISTDDSTGFYKWTAEVVYTTTETLTVTKPEYNAKGELVKPGTFETKQVIHRSPIKLFKDGAEYYKKTSFEMPLLVDDNAKLEIKANYSYGAAAYDREKRTANIVADKEYNDAAVIFAAYNKFGDLLSFEWVNSGSLTKGENTVTAPDTFKVNDGEKMSIMVWDNMKDMNPLFNAYEQAYEEKSEESGSTGNTGDTEITEGTENEN